MKIAIFGAGYVGMSLACLLSKNHTVVLIDVDPDRIALINQSVSPISDAEISKALHKNQDRILGTTLVEKCAGSNVAFIATPTNYDDKSQAFDTRSIENVLEIISSSCASIRVVIKSTVPVGYTEETAKAFSNIELYFSPEFLREGHALHDNLYPSRIIVGIPTVSTRSSAYSIANLLASSAALDESEIPIFLMGASEAEAVKLFSNTFLALRISYFNELDTYSEVRNLDSQSIIEGVCCDPRIGNYYNNPSFGYGGYCLPKDTKQLLVNYNKVPQNLIRAIVDSNETRKHFIANQIASYKPSQVGVYRLIMKSESDNFRESSVLSVIEMLIDINIKVLIYEPSLALGQFYRCAVTHDLSMFKMTSDLIVCNRISEELSDVSDKLYTRDLWHRE